MSDHDHFNLRRHRRSSGRAGLAVAVVLALVGGRQRASAQPPICWRPPVRAPVLDPFRDPPCRWCPGNRGIEYGPTPGTPVRAVEAGIVTFSGPVVGVSYVVVAHPDGRRATYGRLGAIVVTAGAAVRSGQVVGQSTDRLFFGVRDGDTYVDPAPLLGRLASRPRLVPSDGSPPRAIPPSSLVCRPDT